MATKFALMHEHSHQPYGVMSFNGKFTFKLDEGIGLDLWNNIGFIKLDENRYIESDDLFEHLNSRLPITLRTNSSEEKLQYIKVSGLRVASDGFYLREEPGFQSNL